MVENKLYLDSLDFSSEFLQLLVDFADNYFLLSSINAFKYIYQSDKRKKAYFYVIFDIILRLCETS